MRTFVVGSTLICLLTGCVGGDRPFETETESTRCAPQSCDTTNSCGPSPDGCGGIQECPPCPATTAEQVAKVLPVMELRAIRRECTAAAPERAAEVKAAAASGWTTLLHGELAGMPQLAAIPDGRTAVVDILHEGIAPAGQRGLVMTIGGAGEILSKTPLTIGPNLGDFNFNPASGELIAQYHDAFPAKIVSISMAGTVSRTVPVCTDCILRPGLAVSRFGEVATISYESGADATFVEVRDASLRLLRTLRLPTGVAADGLQFFSTGDLGFVAFGHGEFELAGERFGAPGSDTIVLLRLDHHWAVRSAKAMTASGLGVYGSGVSADDAYYVFVMAQGSVTWAGRTVVPPTNTGASVPLVLASDGCGEQRLLALAKAPGHLRVLPDGSFALLRSTVCRGFAVDSYDLTGGLRKSEVVEPTSCAAPGASSPHITWWSATPTADSTLILSGTYSGTAFADNPSATADENGFIMRLSR